MTEGGQRGENLSPDFRAFLDERYEHHYTPEEILGYIYAVLYSPTYRDRYAESLRNDFHTYHSLKPEKTFTPSQCSVGRLCRRISRVKCSGGGSPAITARAITSLRLFAMIPRKNRLDQRDTVL